MKSICYIVLPQALSLDHDSVYHFVEAQLRKYHIDYEVEPYKMFFSEEETYAIAKRKGYDSVADFKAALDIKSDDDGIEDNRYYWIMTQNPQGYWDYFILEEIRPCHELLNESVPYSVVDTDGIWHSERAYGYKPILDFKLNDQHPDNVKVEREWKKFLDSDFFAPFIDYKIAVVTVHS